MLLLSAAGAHAQSNVIWPNDDCPFATPIAGDGAFAFDTGSTFVTTSLPPLPSTCPDCSCSLQFVGIANDVWFAWTADCSGPVEMKTGVNGEPLCNLDTVLAVYAACPPATQTPVTPIVCCDDTCATVGNTCDRASYVQFDAVCGQTYIVRVGAKPGLPGGPGTLKIKCLGKPCPPPTGQNCADCCGAKPTFNDPIYASNFTGKVAVQTAIDYLPTTAPNDNVVTVFNLNASPASPMDGNNWDPVPGSPPTAFRYAAPGLWTREQLGSVYGLALDGTGNIYVTHTTAFNFDQIGVLAGSSATSIYKIQTGSGAPVLFANLPGATNPNDGPGLGNITHDCSTNRFYVSHLADGCIYRLDAGGAVLSKFDHATDTISGPAGEVGTDYTAFVALGERIWAVEAHNGRVYYSVWGQYAPLNGSAVSTIPNRIWSVAIDAITGEFLPNTRQQELQVLAFPPNASTPPGANSSSPVADISFSPRCQMLLGERSMTQDSSGFAHASRALEYDLVGTTWVPSANFRSGHGYPLGAQANSNDRENASGGVDYDFDTAAPYPGRVWCGGDALSGLTSYGFTGIDTTTPSFFTSVPIDYNATYTGGDKTELGDVEIPCPQVGEPPCFNVSNMKVLCPSATDPCFSATFTITNKSAFSIKYVSIPLHPDPNSPITINPNIINLLQQDGSLLDPGESTTITITICNALPGDEFCLTLGLVTVDFFTCCFEEVCFTMPLCDCGQLLEQHFGKVTCSTPGTVSFNFNFTLQNLSNFSANWVIFIPFKDEQATFAKDFFFLPPLPPGGTLPMRVDVIGAVPGEEFCFYVLLQHPSDSPDDCCCAFEKCITVPPCDQVPSNNCPGNVNSDNVVNVNDLLAVINAWGPCPSPCPPDCPADLNHDCLVNVNDLLLVINNWGVCPITR